MAPELFPVFWFLLFLLLLVILFLIAQYRLTARGEIWVYEMKIMRDWTRLYLLWWTYAVACSVFCFWSLEKPWGLAQFVRVRIEMIARARAANDYMMLSNLLGNVGTRGQSGNDCACLWERLVKSRYQRVASWMRARLAWSQSRSAGWRFGLRTSPSCALLRTFSADWNHWFLVSAVDLTRKSISRFL